MAKSKQKIINELSAALSIAKAAVKNYAEDLTEYKKRLEGCQRLRHEAQAAQDKLISNLNATLVDMQKAKESAELRLREVQVLCASKSLEIEKTKESLSTANNDISFLSKELTREREIVNSFNLLLSQYRKGDKA